MEVEINLKGSGLQFNATITLFQATQIMAFISKPDENPTLVRPIINEVRAAPNDEIKTLNGDSEDIDTPYDSPHSAIAQTKAKTNPQKIVALAYYFGATSKNGKLFSVEEILEGFKKAGESTPKNIARDFREAVSAGYVYLEEKGKYRLLSSTDSIPTDGFKKQPKKRTPTKPTGSGQKPVKLSVSESVKKMPVSTGMDSYPNFFDIKVRADQILWVIQYAKSHGIDGLNRFEIMHFVSKVGGDITSKNFTASNTANVKNNYIYSEEEVLRLTPKGEIQLKAATDEPKSA